MGIKSWVTGNRAVQKPHLVVDGTCRPGTRVLDELIEMYTCDITELDCLFPLFCLRHAPSKFDSSMLQKTAFLGKPVLLIATLK